MLNKLYIESPYKKLLLGPVDKTTLSRNIMISNKIIWKNIKFEGKKF